MTIPTYLAAIEKRLQSGISREHAYRADLEELIRELAPGVEVTNEPANVTDSGNPDFVITRSLGSDPIPIGYIEAKDVGKDLTSKRYREQFTRYKRALDNLIITDYVWFRFFEAGELIHEIRLAEVDEANGALTPLPENFPAFIDLLGEFCTFTGQTIHNPKKLAEMMAAKARLLQTILEQALTADENRIAAAPDASDGARTALQEQYHTFKKILIHDLTPAAFADIYAQTLAYGMFAARLHDPHLETFSREEAASLVPQSNPFLRKLFQHVAGYDIDPRIRPTVDNLAEVFRATDVEALLTNFGASTEQNDPVIHFYETFLAEYDPALRKSRGVWYTPEPVVNFIVRAVDDLLKAEFDLPLGLADTSRTTITLQTQAQDKRTKSGYKEVEREVHKVQILDPATGTGTFLAEIVKHIYRTQFAAMRGAWPGYVAEDLIPRLHGFELLMASYAMAHLKLELLLRETGVAIPAGRRLHVYLTNSLEEHHPDTGSLFASWLSQEAAEANRIKRDTPVMVVLGNPPYSGESANKGPWIMDLMEDYKKEPGGEQKLQERNPKWINDDYVKFMRYGQYLIERNGEGILAFINAHGFLDNPTFRGMRWHLLDTYDKIYIIDLHGNSKKRETTPDGGKDENVFDIQQGVSINLLVKTGRKKPGDLAQVYHYDLYGLREEKYEFLWDNNIHTVPYQELPNVAPDYFFVPKDFEAEKRYKSGFSVADLFVVNSVGIVTSRDAFVIAMDKDTLQTRIKDFFALSKAEILQRYSLRENKRWKIEPVQQEAKTFNPQAIERIAYRPFDTRYLYYDDPFIERTRRDVMQHFLKGENVGLVFARQSTDEHWTGIQISKYMIDNRYHFSYKGIPQEAPLYLYPEDDTQDSFLSTQRKPNLNMEIVKKIARDLGLTFTPNPHPASPARGGGEKPGGEVFTPLDLLDYIYAVLHSPTYRETYEEFLKIDFPRVPYPDDPATFWRLVALGGELRRIHLLEAPIVNDFATSYPHDGSNQVTRRLTQRSPGFELTDSERGIGRVWINDQQYFDGVPLRAWDFYIGGYQPAQKWLKYRRGRTLSFEDIRHFQKIIVALLETDRIMQEIDAVEVV